MFESSLLSLINRKCISQTTATLIPSIEAAVKKFQLDGSRKSPSAYAGFDPTGPSLHLGHASVILMLVRLQKMGIRPIALIGGATAMIGDPSGKSVDRPILNEEDIARNIVGIRENLEIVLDFSRTSHTSNPSDAELCPFSAEIINNADFYKNMSVIEFMRSIGRHGRMGTMLSKESVKSRLGGMGIPGGSPLSSSDLSKAGKEFDSPTNGLSFAEFSYQLFQANDFAELNHRENCIVQVGGSDQWGNITAGIDMIHRTRPPGTVAEALTIPLLTTSDGRKFGKSEGNALYLSPRYTSNYSFYQYLFRTHDEDVESLLNQLTLKSSEEVSDIMSRHRSRPEARLAQMELADSVTEMFRGRKAVESSIQAATIIYRTSTSWSERLSQIQHQSGFKKELSASNSFSLESLRTVVETGEIPVVEIPDNSDFLEMMVISGAAQSKSDARKLILANGVYINGEKVDPSSEKWKAKEHVSADGKRTRPFIRNILLSDFVNKELALLAVGKKKTFILKVRN